MAETGKIQNVYRLFLTLFSLRDTILMSEISEVSFGRIRRRKPHTVLTTDGNTMVEHHQGIGTMNHFADRLGALNQLLG